MPSRIFPLITENFYHIFNRGNEKRPIFENRKDYQRFLKTIKYYQLEGPKPKFSRFPSPLVTKLDSSKKLVEICAYCLMPNHFHFLLKQNRDNGITEFISKLSNSYTKYYNTKYGRVGHLFQGEFKSVVMENNEQLVHVSRYIHLNPFSSSLVKDIKEYPWSSYLDYLGLESDVFCSKKEILNFFKNPNDYQQFVSDHASYAREVEFIKHKVIEEI